MRDRVMLRDMRVTVSVGSVLPELIEALRTAGCLAARLSDDTCTVRHPKAVDDEEARVELAFYLRAWQLTRPAVAVAFA